jgi:hypothetical protein
LFLESIKSPATRVTYKQSLDQFKEATGFNLIDSKTKGKVLQGKINRVRNTTKKRGASYSSIYIIISALQAYCDAHNIARFFQAVL